MTLFRRRTLAATDVNAGKTGGAKKTQLAQGAHRPGGKLRDVKRPACSEPADRRVSKPRPGCMPAMPQTCRAGRGARRTPTSLPRDEAQKAHRPQSPAEEAINLRRRMGVQRPKRSTAAAEQAPGRGKDQRQTSTCRTGPRTKDRGQRRRFGPRWLRRTNVKLRIASIPSWVTLGSPVQQGSRTQVSKAGNLGENLQHDHYYLTRDRMGMACGGYSPNRSFWFQKTSTKVLCQPRA